MERFTYPDTQAAELAIKTHRRRGEQYVLSRVENERWVVIATDGRHLTSAGTHREPRYCDTCGSCDLEPHTGQCLNPLHHWEPQPETADLFTDVLVLEMEEAA